MYALIAFCAMILFMNWRDPVHKQVILVFCIDSFSPVFSSPLMHIYVPCKMSAYQSGDHQYNKYVFIVIKFLCFIVQSQIVTNAPSEMAMSLHSHL